MHEIQSSKNLVERNKIWFWVKDSHIFINKIVFERIERGVGAGEGSNLMNDLFGFLIECMILWHLKWQSDICN